MPDESAATSETSVHPLPVPDQPQPVLEYLIAYRPEVVETETWLLVSNEAITLVMRAGEPTQPRVAKDIQIIAAVIAHLIERGRPISLDEALSDTTLASFDATLRASNQARKNKRGRIRRLQAAHRGLPWRPQRRGEGERIAKLVQPTEVAQLEQLLSIADGRPADPDATAFTRAVAALRADRAKADPAAHPDDLDRLAWDRVWTAARRFAQRHDWPVTRRVLHAVLTHEVLAREEPLAVLVARHGLSRRDLDRGLTYIHQLPAVPDPAHHGLLRGAP